MKYKRHHGKFYIASTGRKPGSKHFYRPVYSGSSWNQFLRAHAVGLLLQVCCGGSHLGKVRIDHDVDAPGVNVIGDALRLPIRDNGFDTVACDPPYEMDYVSRIQLQRELSRVSRLVLIFKAPWIPRATGWHLSQTMLIGSHTCANVAVMSVLKRGTAAQQGLGI